MLREVPLPRLFEIWDVCLPPNGTDDSGATWPAVVFFDNLRGTVARDILGVLPISPSTSRVSCHVPLPAHINPTQASGTILCDQQLYVPRDAFVRRRGSVPDALRKRLLRETWNQLPAS